MSIFVILILALGVMAYIGYPFWGHQETVLPVKRRGNRITSPQPAQIEDFQDELELDREAGRIEEQDYAALAPSDAEDEIERRVRELRKKRAETQNAKPSKRIKR
jgi:hypothetical protein